MKELETTYSLIDKLEQDELAKLINYINSKMHKIKTNPKKSIDYLEELSNISTINTINDPINWQKKQREEIDDFN